MKPSSTRLSAIMVLALHALLPALLSATSVSGPFAISAIDETNASDCSATDGSFNLTLDASNLGTSPYDISIDNGATWLVNNQSPVSNVLSVSTLQWGTYPIAVRDAGGDIIYPGYAAIEGCTMDVTLETPHVFTTSTVVGATGYTWTTSIGSIQSGQGTTSATVDYSSESHLATGTVCVQPTGPTCTAPATCFGIEVISSCFVGLDNDNDGISDICDLDDDNDGIPDLIESNCNSSIIALGSWNNNLVPFETATIWSPMTIASMANESFGAGLTVVEEFTTLSIAGIDQPSYTAAIGDDDYIEFAFTTQPGINTLFIRNLFYTKNDFGVSDEYGYNITLAYSDDAFVTSRVVLRNHLIDNTVTGSQQDIRVVADDNFAPLSANTTYTFRLYFYGKSTPGDARFDDFAIESGQCTFDLDFDNDGVANHLDLDSDNDGILDVDEAGHGASDSNDDGVIDGLPAAFGLNGLFDGIETSADSDAISYSLSDSESSPDGVFDAYELDSDGDGCLDAREEGVSDSDTDGIAGTGVASVNAAGLVSSNTYSGPSNSTWQNPSTSNCFYIDGSVFEDINYGGGPGREFGEANVSAQASGWSNLDVGLDNFRVELYSSTGAFLAADLTDFKGIYRFENISPGDYTVRFVTRSAYSNRSSNSTGTREYAVPVYRSIQSAIFANEIGGVDPSREDAPENTTNANISSLNTATLVAQAVSSVSVTTSSVSDVDLGLSFSVITNTNAQGIGSLSQYILNANELDNLNLDLEDDPTGRPVLLKPSGMDVSIFEISGSGPHSIALVTALPEVEDEFTHISGYTQLGSIQGTPQTRTIAIGLDGSSGSFNGLELRADNLKVSGLAVYSMAVGIYLADNGSSNTHVWGNYVGLEADGVTTGTNSNTGIYAYNQAGGFIGTDADGINDLNEGNVVANSYEGINVRASSGILLAGNYIGIDHTGSVDAGNRYFGIFLRDCPAKNVIGFDDAIPTLTAAAARNVSSGNGTDGIRLYDSNDQVLAGNYFGTDYLGTSIIENEGYGVQILGSSSYNQIGTDSDGFSDVEERNVISGNGAGIRFVVASTGDDNWIAGNYIGVGSTGNVAVPNRNHGIVLNGNHTNLIIGTNADGVRDVIERNIISGNREDGIRIDGTNAARISGNYIGVGADGVISIPNENRGIIVSTTSANCIIGYSPSYVNSSPFEVGNIIRGNGDSGIAFAGSGVNNRASRNSYGQNAQLAIDLDYDLVSINDNGDSDVGPNNMLNYPVLTYSKQNTTTLRIRGFAPSGSTLELYVADGGLNPSPLPSGYTSSFGEGYTYLTDVVEGSASDANSNTGTYTDDGSGVSSTKTQHEFTFDIPLASLSVPLTPGMELTAIAIDGNGNTSEFSGRASVLFVEICDDLIDNDGDNFIDCADEDCPSGNPVLTVTN